MAKREKIILGLMIVAILYGAFHFLIRSTPKDVSAVSAAKLAEARGLATKVADNLAKDSLTKVEKYVLARVDAEWPRDPFVDRLPVPKARPGKAGELDIGKFAYSVFIGAGQKKLAIINGMEYQAGEELQTGGYVVRNISPDKVILENVAQGGTIEVPVYRGKVLGGPIP